MNKNKAKDPPKERLIKGVALSDDELENVTGGSGFIYCPYCGQYISSGLFAAHSALCGTVYDGPNKPSAI